MLEIRILALEPRVPYGVNSSNRGTGVLPDLLTGQRRKVIKFDMTRNVALFSNDIEVPLQAVHGIMAVAPTRESWMSARARPGAGVATWISNKLTVGATLFLPVFHDGASSLPAIPMRHRGRRRSTAPPSKRR